jgi:hypothetical protein
LLAATSVGVAGGIYDEHVVAVYPFARIEYMPDNCVTVILTLTGTTSRHVTDCHKVVRDVCEDQSL